MSDNITDRIARAICRERCAFMGEPACWQLDADDGEAHPWPNTDCDSPGCMAIAEAVYAELEAINRE